MSCNFPLISNGCARRIQTKFSALPRGAAICDSLADKPVHLRVEIDYERLHFAFRIEGADKDWRWLPQQFDASILSDEASAPGQPNFTGAFVGMACEDTAGTARAADFDYFEYKERS